MGNTHKQVARAVWGNQVLCAAAICTARAAPPRLRPPSTFSPSPLPSSVRARAARTCLFLSVPCAPTATPSSASILVDVSVDVSIDVIPANFPLTSAVQTVTSAIFR